MDFNKTTTIKEGQEAKKAGYKVPFGTVSITDKAKTLIDSALVRKWVTKGAYVAEFESKFAALFGVKHGIAVSSGNLPGEATGWLAQGVAAPMTAEADGAAGVAVLKCACG